MQREVITENALTSVEATDVLNCALWLYRALERFALFGST